MNKGTTAIGIGLIVILLLAGFLGYWFLLRDDDKTPSVSDPDITLLPSAGYTSDILDSVQFKLNLDYTTDDITTLQDSSKVEYISVITP